MALTSCKDRCGHGLAHKWPARRHAFRPRLPRIVIERKLLRAGGVIQVSAASRAQRDVPRMVPAMTVASNPLRESLTGQGVLATNTRAYRFRTTALWTIRHACLHVLASRLRQPVNAAPHRAPAKTTASVPGHDSLAWRGDLVISTPGHRSCSGQGRTCASARLRRVR